MNKLLRTRNCIMCRSQISRKTQYKCIMVYTIFVCFQFPTLKMSLVVYNSKRRREGTLTKNAERCLNRLKDYTNEASLR